MICPMNAREFYFPSGTCHRCGIPWIDHPGNLFRAIEAKYGKFYEALSQRYLEEQKCKPFKK